MRSAFAIVAVAIGVTTAVSAVALGDAPGSTPGHTPGQTGCPPAQPGHTPGQTGPGETGPGQTGPGQTPGVGGCPNNPGHRRHPTVRRLALAPTHFRVEQRGHASVARTGGARVSYVASVAGTARFTVRRPHKSGPATRLRGSFSQGAVRGRNVLHFTGRLNRRALSPGRYALVVRLRDLTGRRSAAKRVRFTIVR